MMRGLAGQMRPCIAPKLAAATAANPRSPISVIGPRALRQVIRGPGAAPSADFSMAHFHFGKTSTTA